jgi:subtilisin family serine protease
MKKGKLFFGSAAFLVAAAFIFVSFFSANAAAVGEAKSYLIMAHTQKLPKGFAKKIQELNGAVTSAIPELGIVVATSRDSNFPNNVSAFRAVRSVVPNIEARWIDPKPKNDQMAVKEYGNPPVSGDDDALFDLQWGHDAVDAPEAWETGARGQGVRVAVLDDGIDSDHPDLAPNLNVSLCTSFIPGESFEYNDTNPGDPFSHGCHISGTIAAADNADGIIGIAPEAELVMVKVLSSLSGEGPFSGIIEGIVYAANIDADIINMSLGLGLRRSGYVDIYQTPNDKSDDLFVGAWTIAELATAVGRATNYAFRQGATLIASAGNGAGDGDHDADFIHLPSDAPHVLSISATAPYCWACDFTANLDEPAHYTDYGQSVIDFAAPGGDWDLANDSLAICMVAGIIRYCFIFDLVFSSGSDGAWYWEAGTSMAAPHVAGVAALIIGENGGDMHPADVRDILKWSADDLGKPGKDDFYGHGRVNAFNAVNY